MRKVMFVVGLILLLIGIVFAGIGASHISEANTLVSSGQFVVNSTAYLNYISSNVDLEIFGGILAIIGLIALIIGAVKNPKEKKKKE
jgi:hypothetical protein